MLTHRSNVVLDQRPAVVEAWLVNEHHRSQGRGRHLRAWLWSCRPTISTMQVTQSVKPATAEGGTREAGMLHLAVR